MMMMSWAKYQIGISSVGIYSYQCVDHDDDVEDDCGDDVGICGVICGLLCLWLAVISSKHRYQHYPQTFNIIVIIVIIVIIDIASL